MARNGEVPSPEDNPDDASSQLDPLTDEDVAGMSYPDLRRLASQMRLNSKRANN